MNKALWIRRTLTGVLLATAATGAVAQDKASSPRGAQASGDIVEELIVTARRREEQLQEVPAAASLLTSATLQELGGASSFGDLIRFLPGATLVDVGSNQSEVSIRGAGSGTARTAGVDAPVAVLKDGVSVTGGNVGGRSYVPIDTFDIERTEIVRGPQGALYGVNAVGGVINVISKRPALSPGFSAVAGYSPAIDRYEAQLIGNLPLGESVAVRFGVDQARRDGGFFRNAATGKYGDTESRTGAKLSVLWTPIDAIKIYSIISSGTDTTPPGNVRSLSIVNDPVFATLATTDVDGPYSFGNNGRDSTRRVTQDWTTVADIDFGPVTLTSTTGFRDRSSKVFVDGDNTAPGYAQSVTPAQLATCATRLCENVTIEGTELAAQDLRLSGAFGPRAAWMLGASVNSRQSDQAAILDGRTTSAANPALSPGQNNAVVSKEEELQTGVYGTLTWDVVERLSMDLSGRYNVSKKKTATYTVLRQAGTVLCPYQNPYTAALGTTCAASRVLLDDTFKNFAPTLSARFELTDHARLFGSIGRGYRAGGFNTNSVIDPAIPASFDPEKTTAYEGGLKFEALHSYFTLTAFRNEYSNQLVTLTSLAGNVSRNYRTNIGRAATYGIDSEVFGRARLPKRYGALTYSASVQWLKGGPDEGPYAGRELEGSPVYGFTASLIWRVPLWDEWNLSSSINYRGQRGGFTSTPLISNSTKLDDFDLFGGRIALQNPTWVVEAVVTNLFDTQYAALRGPIQNIYNDPRYVTLRVRYALGSEARGRR